MIIVLKRGNRYKVNCPDCGCEFSYEKEDVEVKQLGMNEYERTVNCPECGRSIISPYMMRN